MSITYFRSGTKHTITPPLHLVARTIHELKRRSTILISKVK